VYAGWDRFTEFENIVLRRMFGNRSEEVRGMWEKLQK
jgi:hypothetical protein